MAIEEQALKLLQTQTSDVCLERIVNSEQTVDSVETVYYDFEENIFYEQDDFDENIGYEQDSGIDKSAEKSQDEDSDNDDIDGKATDTDNAVDNDNYDEGICLMMMILMMMIITMMMMILTMMMMMIW